MENINIYKMFAGVCGLLVISGSMLIWFIIRLLNQNDADHKNIRDTIKEHNSRHNETEKILCRLSGEHEANICSERRRVKR
jgi:hypothetical protein